jgi:alkaline phosphatase D
VLSGDIHAFGVANLNAVAPDPASPVVASEFVTSSITSQGVPDKLAGQVLSENPNLLFGEPRYRGYLRLDVTAASLRADLVAMDDVSRRDSGRRVLASYVVDSGRPGPQSA